MLVQGINRLVLWLFQISGWKFEGDRPPYKRFVMIGAPHTSNWDFLLTMALLAKYDIPLKFMVKSSVFWWPLGPFIKRIGAIPVDRSTRENRVEKTVSAILQQDEIAIGILPEGTRKRVSYWKTGFYYIALGANIPIILVKIDGPNKKVIIGPALFPSGDLQTDMEQIARFYDGVLGIRPENTSPVRIKPRN